MGVIFKNNVMYGAGDIEISPIIYSEEEREVGVWTDGKPLYQKTSLVNISSGTNTLDTIINGENIRVIEAFAIYNNIQLLNLNYFNSSNDKCIIYTNQNNVYCEATNTFVASYTKVLTTYQYTKTTDTPGSGTWAPSGVPAVHYSTNEQVVGTWIDGSTIYEKTIVTSSISNTLVDIDLGFAIGMGVVVHGYYLLNDANGSMLSANQYLNSNSFSWTHIEKNTHILRCALYGYTGVGYITIRYTKTTS